MSEFSIRSDSINVEQIMQQIRSRIREKRGIDYTEEEIRELANVKLERFLDPKNIRSDLLEHYRQRSAEAASAPRLAGEFDPTSVYRSSRPGVVGRMLHLIRRLLHPILKLFFNPGPLLDSVSEQSRVVRRTAAVVQERVEMDALVYEVMNNLVVEMTRLAIDMKNHKMRVESVAARLDFDERRARALEEALLEPRQPSGAAEKSPSEGAGERRRRRRRRGRRRSGNGEGSTDAEASADAAQVEPDVEPDTPSDAAQVAADVEPDTRADAAQVEPDVEPDTPSGASPEDGPLDPDEKS